MHRVAMALLAFVLVSPLPAQDTLPEMWDEPSHQLLFQRGRTRIVEVVIPPGVTTLFHNHRFATIYVLVADALVSQQIHGGDWEEPVAREYRQGGAVMQRLDYVGDNLYHRVRNTDRQKYHLVSIVNDAQPSAEVAADFGSASGGAVDNPWFLVHRLALEPGQRSGVLRYDNDAVVIQTGAGSSHIVENRVMHSFKTVPGAVSWHAADVPFRIVNSGTDEIHLVIIESRDPAADGER